jgi:protein RecA
MERRRNEPLSTQVKRKVSSAKNTFEKEEKEGSFAKGRISTGSTLLDLAISGGRVWGGGLPGGIFVEIFGPAGSGKTVLLCEIAGDVQRKGGEVTFHDPEARLNPTFAKMFGLKITKDNYKRPNVVPEVFKAVRKWEPENTDVINGIMADSLAALSTNLEMEKEEGDKMGGRRAKEFSEELRRTCRILSEKNYLMVASNQIRENMDAGAWGPKYVVPGGKAMEHYPSLRLKVQVKKKLTIEKSFHGKAVKRIIGVESEVEVYKSSIWKPYRTAPVTIIFDYGIDDIRQNLQFVKEYSKKGVYTVGSDTLDKSMDKAISIVEKEGMEDALKQEVIILWGKIEHEFDSSHRKPRRS